jgi:A/G-specific adenine glycosylase
VAGFAARLLDWHARHGRRGLPWQGSRDRYRVWLSEVMLQQTQVATAIPYYERFVARWPDVQVLAAAPLAEVMALWAGLGYYARARNLHRCAQVVVAEHGGRFPASSAALAGLPGIGRSTAAAIAAFCFDERAAILDGNVKRVLARHFGIAGYPGVASVERALWQRAQRLLPPAAAMPAYTQALMDLGATVCTRRSPGCDRCPLRATCVARRSGRVAQLPAPRPPRALRIERAHLLVALCRGRVLVEQRPPHGIWGGLLSLPQFASAAALRRALAGLGGAAPPQALPARQHAFTHCTLSFTPHLARLPAAVPLPAGARWLRWGEVHSAALPAPVRRLLAELAPTAKAPRAASGSG